MTSLADISLQQSRSGTMPEVSAKAFSQASENVRNIDRTGILGGAFEALRVSDEINTLIENENLDALLLPHRTSHAPITGNPCITVPAEIVARFDPRECRFHRQKMGR
ncbi:MAG: hypothetical protein MZU97_05565 [Bacillus subtilis]|nr:hypothetical protein [Bacillus subtilis]